MKFQSGLFGHRHLIKIPVCLVCQEESLEKPKKGPVVFPIGSMYGIFTYISHKKHYISHKNQLNVGKYTIHGCFGVVGSFVDYDPILSMHSYGP